MNNTRNNHRMLGVALFALLAGSLAACSTPDRTETTVTTVAHGAGELSAHLQISEQIQLERQRLYPLSPARVVEQDIAIERERLQPRSPGQVIEQDIATERERLRNARA
jgi:hypothetical protein